MRLKTHKRKTYLHKKKRTSRHKKKRTYRHKKRKIKKTKKRRINRVIATPVVRQRGGMDGLMNVIHSIGSILSGGDDGAAAAAAAAAPYPAPYPAHVPAPAPAPDPSPAAAAAAAATAATASVDETDILVQMKSMVDSGLLSREDIGERDEGGLRDGNHCHLSQQPLLKVIYKYHVRGVTTLQELNPNYNYTWEGTAGLLHGGHYIIEADIYKIHTYFIEIKEGAFRILSLWCNAHGFLEFPSKSVWGNFDKHGNYNEFLEKLKKINFGVNLGRGGKAAPPPRGFECADAGDVINEIFGIANSFPCPNPGEDKKGTLQNPKFVITL